MQTDIMAELGPLFLGSRLKRLAERLQAGAAKAFRDAGHDVQPGHMPLLAVLDRYGPTTVNALVTAIGVSQPAVTRNLAGLVSLGLVASGAAAADRRQRTITLTPAGKALLADVKQTVWPRTHDAVAAMCAPLSGPLLDQVAALEAALAERPLDARIAALPAPLRLVPYSPAIAAEFGRINSEWIAEMYTLEPHDRAVLGDPQEHIIDRGGDILFADSEGLGIVGACALMPSGGGAFELTKMGVSATARGRKVGEFLLAGVIARARAMHAEGRLAELYLLTNTKSAAAIHLYKKLGFEHSAEIMARYGSRYARCNVAMRFPL